MRRNANLQVSFLYRRDKKLILLCLALLGSNLECCIQFRAPQYKKDDIDVSEGPAEDHQDGWGVEHPMYAE